MVNVPKDLRFEHLPPYRWSVLGFILMARRIKRYNILTISGEEKLIAPMKEDNGEIKYYVCYHDSVNILEKKHFAVGHGGRTRMLRELKSHIIYWIFLPLLERRTSFIPIMVGNLVIK
ncbi:hypothetical protein HHI36_013313 [Cryptolaemus montrouzieri]|uniref:Uncharacterized protein n=1 Tax=Cryptolaemus montrouzieri TaxID=559131 RepID=A0ABD2NH31_9CUCU